MKEKESNYIQLLVRLKERIRTARQKALFAVNEQLILVYYEIGTAVLKQQVEEGWGSKVIDRLAADLRKEFSDMHGFSVRNLKYMRAFADAWPNPEIVQQPAAQIQSPEIQSSVIVQQLVARIPWGHHQVLLDKLKTHNEREFYLRKTIENGWSRAILIEQIKTDLFKRQGNALNNFNLTLPSPLSDLAKEILKNPYNLEFTGLSEQIQERELEKALITHIQKFLLELGRGFSFAGNQKNLIIEGDDFFPDLLFFNYILNAFIVIELKIGEFRPEYAGKLNFYVNAINEQLRGTEHKPTIGVLLCKTPNHTVVKYSLTGIDNPIGVSDYELVKSLPANLKGEIPTVEELEAEIEKEYEGLQSPSEKRLSALKLKLGNLKSEEIKSGVTFQLLYEIFDKCLMPLYRKLLEKLSGFNTLFVENSYQWAGLEKVRTLDELGEQWKTEKYLHLRMLHKFYYYLKGFKLGGPTTFDIVFILTVHTEEFNYGFSLLNLNNQQPILQKLYHQKLTTEEIDMLAETAHELIMAELESKVAHTLLEKTDFM